MATFIGMAPRIEVGDPIALDEVIDPALPDWLAATRRHSNCPNHDVPLVQVLHADGRPMRVMAFQGVHDSGAIAVSRPLLHGVAPHLHLIPVERIRPLA